MHLRIFVLILSKLLSRKKSLINLKKHFSRLLTASGGMNTLRRQHGNLWSYTREPIKAPLLMKLQEQSDKFDKAVEIFVWIMRVLLEKFKCLNI